MIYANACANKPKNMTSPSKFPEVKEVKTPEVRFGFDQAIQGNGSRESLIRNKRLRERRKEGFEKADEIIKSLEGSYRRSAMLLKALSNVTPNR